MRAVLFTYEAEHRRRRALRGARRRAFARARFGKRTSRLRFFDHASLLVQELMKLGHGRENARQHLLEAAEVATAVRDALQAHMNQANKTTN